MDACILAAQYADSMHKARNELELLSIARKIKADLKNLSGFEDWLRSEWRSANEAMKKRGIGEFSDCLNAEGKKWARGQGIIGNEPSKNL